MFKLLWKKKALVLFLIVLVILLPAAVARPAQMLSKAVFTEISIDKKDGGFVFGGKMSLGKEELDIETTASSIGDAINNIALEKSRQVSFAHCTNITLGEGLKNENLADVLKFFLFHVELNNNCAVAWKEKGRKTTLEKFYKDYLYYSSASVLTQGATDSAVIRSGRYQFSLDEKETDALSIIRGEKIKKRLVYEDEVIYVSRNTSKLKTKFIDNKPTVDIALKINGEIESDPEVTSGVKDSVTKAMKKELENNIDGLLGKLYGTTDVLGLYNDFYRHHTKEFKKYLENHSFTDFMSELDFRVKVDISL